MVTLYQKVCPQCLHSFSTRIKRRICCSRTCVNQRQKLVDPLSTLAARFWAKVQKSDNPDVCWTWNGATSDKGYGVILASSRPKQQTQASRVSWFLHHGYWPDLFVLHRCDNPPCTNPRHLFLGTNQDNINDMFSKGRNAIRPKGALSSMAVLTQEQADCIRREYASCRSIRILASRYNVSRETIRDIINGKRYIV